MVRSDHDQRQGGFCKRKLMNESIAVEKFGIMSDKLREKNKRHGIAKSQKKKVVKVVKVKGENGCINKKKVTPKIIKSNKKAHKVKSETIELPPTLNDQKIDLFGEEKDCFKHEDDDALSSYEEKSLDMLKDEDDQNMYSEESSCNEDQDILQENNTLQKGDEESIEEKDCEVLFTGDLSQVKERLATAVAKLAKNHTGQEKHMKMSRADLVKQMTQDVSIYYGYSLELAEYFMQLLNPSECLAFFEAVETSRPVTLRTNMLHTRRRDLAKILIERGCNVDPVGDWTKVGLKVIESSVPVGATPEYCAGHYMIQSASSFVPVMALAPQPGELILDMAAAPGGKSTYIGQLMKNSGVLFCNEYNKERLSSLVGNLHRMGITNSVVLNLDGAALPGKLPPLDRVLLDAPCSGLGVITRDPSIKAKRTLKDFKEHACIQKKLLTAAVDLCSAASTTGGYIVYSTCSLSVEENEEVIDYILKTRSVKVVPLGFPDEMWSAGFSSYREKRFHPSLKLTRRIYPHLSNMDGFFVCKLKKVSDVIPKRERKDRRKSNIYVKKLGKDQWKSELFEETSQSEHFN